MALRYSQIGGLHFSCRGMFSNLFGPAVFLVVSGLYSLRTKGTRGGRLSFSHPELSSSCAVSSIVGRDSKVSGYWTVGDEWPTVWLTVGNKILILKIMWLNVYLHMLTIWNIVYVFKFKNQPEKIHESITESLSIITPTLYTFGLWIHTISIADITLGRIIISTSSNNTFKMYTHSSTMLLSRAFPVSSFGN